jgi:hypothetical protein
MANTKWSIPDVIAITKWSIQGSGRRCKPRASNGAMTVARNSQVFLRSGLFNGISGRRWRFKRSERRCRTAGQRNWFNGE